MEAERNTNNNNNNNNNNTQAQQPLRKKRSFARRFIIFASFSSIIAYLGYSLGSYIKKAYPHLTSSHEHISKRLTLNKDLPDYPFAHPKDILEDHNWKDTLREWWNWPWTKAHDIVKSKVSSPPFHGSSSSSSSSSSATTATTTSSTSSTSAGVPSAATTPKGADAVLSKVPDSGSSLTASLPAGTKTANSTQNRAPVTPPNQSDSKLTAAEHEAVAHAPTIKAAVKTSIPVEAPKPEHRNNKASESTSTTNLNTAPGSASPSSGSTSTPSSGAAPTPATYKASTAPTLNPSPAAHVSPATSQTPQTHGDSSHSGAHVGGISANATPNSVAQTPKATGTKGADAVLSKVPDSGSSLTASLPAGTKTANATEKGAPVHPPTQSHTDAAHAPTSSAATTQAHSVPVAAKANEPTKHVPASGAAAVSATNFATAPTKHAEKDSHAAPTNATDDVAAHPTAKEVKINKDVHTWGPTIGHTPSVSPTPDIIPSSAGPSINAHAITGGHTISQTPTSYSTSTPSSGAAPSPATYTPVSIMPVNPGAPSATHISPATSMTPLTHGNNIQSNAHVGGGLSANASPNSVAQTPIPPPSSKSDNSSSTKTSKKDPSNLDLSQASPASIVMGRKQ